MEELQRAFICKGWPYHNDKAGDSWEPSMIQGSLIVKTPDKADKTSLDNRR